MDIHSKKIMCCGAKSWSMVIGWLQIVECAVWMTYILVALGAIVVAFSGTGGDDNSLLFTAATVILVLIFLVVSIQLFAAIILVIGVKQQNPRKLKIWFVINVTFVVLLTITILYRICYQRPFAMDVALFSNIVSTLLGSFFIWVVNIHRQELLHATNSVIVFRSFPIANVATGNNV